MSTSIFRVVPGVWLFLASLLLTLPACDSADAPDSTPPLSLDIDQRLILPDSIPEVRIPEGHRILADEAQLRFHGNLDGVELDHSITVDLRRSGQTGPLYASIDAAEVLWPLFSPEPGSTFSGTLSATLTDQLDATFQGETPLQWTFKEQLAPELSFNASDQIFSNEMITAEGQGILRPEEGESIALIEEGQVVTEGGQTLDLNGQRLPLVWDGTRERSSLRLPPDLIGVRPGHLEARIRFKNHHRLGRVIEQDEAPPSFSATLSPSFIADLTTPQVSRGQRIELQGRGLLAPEDAQSIEMELRLQGHFHPHDQDLDPLDWTDSQALYRSAHEVKEGRRADLEAWSTVEDRSLQGLAAIPGTFEGEVTPIFYDNQGTYEGLGWDGELTIEPTHQAVHLKYLPGFSIALERFGLRNVDRAIREQILEVVRRDYDGINISFSESEPHDFIEYSTIEIGGPDPTGSNAFGFDNTFHDQAKDTGNLHLDNYLGGINPDSGEAFNNPYGGVFVESFAQFSPTIAPEMGHASERFDDIFSPFMPELGGDPVGLQEWPGGDREAAIEAAISAFANAVGNTVSHELGHAMGLAHFEEDWDTPGNRFHNHGEKGHIMDSGNHRSFEIRANIDGKGPSTFNATNRHYLETILPHSP